MEVAADSRCNFLGNVTVGKDVALATLQQLYHAVRLSSDETICKQTLLHILLQCTQAKFGATYPGAELM